MATRLARLASSDEAVVPAPLFDRLVDEAPESGAEPRPLRAYDRDQLRVSVAIEVAQLLNTRCSQSLDELARQPRSVLNYGLPDLTHFATVRNADPKALARLIADTVAAFEPRLTNLRVEMTSLDPRSGRGGIQVFGDLRLGRVSEPVSFPVLIDPGGASSEQGEAS